MAKYLVVIVVAIAAVGVVLAMQGRQPETVVQEQAIDPHAGHNHPPGEHPGDAQAAGYTGKVLETMNSGGYTYVHIDTGQEQVWAAGPETTVEEGSVVMVPAGMAMQGFKSDTLNRTFDTIYFVSEIRNAGSQPGGGGMPAGHPPITSSDAGSDMDFSGIEVASGGKTVSAIIAEREGLRGKKVKVRGKVVKFTPGVMKRNWIHLRDGSGGEGANDLTVTTVDEVKVGDVIVAEGTVVLDQDFGFGYAYDVIVENATVKVE